MSSSGSKSGVKSSFDAFSKVDEIVSKPVLGSDGAASWQEFRKDVKYNRTSVAPKAPLKKADRLGTGFTSWEQEQQHEDKVRKDAGHVQAGSGYTNFKKKNSAEDAAERKRRKRIEARIRPDDKTFFIPSETYQGSKFDYVFMTKPDRGTGYYWDGMDSVKQLRGELEEPVEVAESEAGAAPAEDTAKPKKKKRKKSAGPVIVNDPNNPMEQVAAILKKRNQQLSSTSSDPTLPPGWEAAKDPHSSKPYYFNRATGERSWTKPAGTGESNADGDALPEGWKSAKDAASGKIYYFHTDGTTKWDKPTT